MLSRIILNLFIGILIGWMLEFIYRSITNERVVMPKFLDYQMYGLTGAFLAILYFLDISIYFKLILMFVFPSLLEFSTGYLYWKIKGIHLWDYSKTPLNFMGIICLPFSFFWFIVAVVYYFSILPLTMNIF